MNELPQPEEGLYESIYIFSVHLEKGDLVQKHVSRKLPPPVGKKLILIVDEAYARFTVHAVSTAMQKNYQYYVLKVSQDQTK